MHGDSGRIVGAVCAKLGLDVVALSDLGLSHNRMVKVKHELKVYRCHLITAVAAIHAGWRSLCDGVIEATIKSLGLQSEHLMAWLGPAIGPSVFEVGNEVREAFKSQDRQAENAFQAVGDKWLCDLYLLAKQRLHNLDVTKVYGQTDCTFSNPSKYFSFRRDGVTGRMATMIWFE